MQEVSIPLSKSKILLLSLLCLGFVLLGLWLLLLAPELDIFGALGIYFQKIVGALSIGFFGPAGFFLVRKSLDKTPGLVISNEGIIDNSSMVAAGKIIWSDVKGIKESTVAGERFIRVEVKNPQKYIDRQKGGFQRKSVEINYQKYGSPIQISANGLDATHEEIVSLLRERIETRKKPKSKRKKS